MVETMSEALRRARIEVAQLEVLVPLRDHIEEVMETDARFKVVFIDTHLLESRGETEERGIWFSGALAEWLEVNGELIDSLGHSAVHRIVVLPTPRSIENVATRRRFVEYVRLFLHVHLWHGVVCPIYFVDWAKAPSAKIISDNIFVAMPWKRQFVSMPGFFSDRVEYGETVEGSKSDLHLREALKQLGLHGKAPLWLHYDEQNFQGGSKLRGWRWDTLRSFFAKLYGYPIHCVLCHAKIPTISLDHIAPFARGFKQTLLNFQPLCPPCNSAKGIKLIGDPDSIPLYLPPSARSERLREIVTTTPPWLGNRRTDYTKPEISRWLADL